MEDELPAQVIQGPYVLDAKSKSDAKSQDDLTQKVKPVDAEKPFNCKTCDKTFKRAGHLANHEKKHLRELALTANKEDENPFHCKKCDSRFPTKSALKKHAKACNTDKSATTENDNKLSESEKHQMVKNLDNLQKKWSLRSRF